MSSTVYGKNIIKFSDPKFRDQHREIYRVPKKQRLAALDRETIRLGTKRR